MRIALLVLGLLALGLAGCTSPEAANGSSSEPEAPDWETYRDHIQQPLFNLAVDHASSSDDAERETGVEITTHRMVQVEIQMADPTAELPTGFLVLEEGRAELGESLIVQAYVRVDQLLDLSLEPEIGYIRTPTQPRR